MDILLISDDIELCKLVNNLFEPSGLMITCVSSYLEAIEFPDHVKKQIELFIFDATNSKSLDTLFLQNLLKKIDRGKLSIISADGDTYWESYAAKYDIPFVFSKPLQHTDMEKLYSWLTLRIERPREVVGTASTDLPTFHIEELDNNRFFLAASPTMLQLYKDIRTLAPIDIPVLILGESGVGKEIVAMLLHKYHSRSERMFLNVNCAALPTELLESELFGYEAGAFTGALKSKPGKFELANKGTLLLDEIGEMSPQMQAKLLHVLQDGSFSRLGARSSTQVDVRVLAATNIDMQEAISEKRFREDLYYRLNTITITIPPLRERREEIPLLIEQMTRRTGIELDRPFTFSQRIIEAAQEYHWPGNLRELRNFVTRTLILQNQDAAYRDLRTKIRTAQTYGGATPVEDLTCKKSPSATRMKDAINEVKNQTEIRMLQDALSASGWNRRRAAMNLNISYRSLLYKIQQHRLTA
jgi:DNA-binding NtrC family response regulator